MQEWKLFNYSFQIIQMIQNLPGSIVVGTGIVLVVVSSVVGVGMSVKKLIRYISPFLFNVGLLSSFTDIDTEKTCIHAVFYTV